MAKGSFSPQVRMFHREKYSSSSLFLFISPRFLFQMEADTPPVHTARDLFQRWHRTVPLDGLINVCLVLSGTRTIAQFDATYHDEGTNTSMEQFLASVRAWAMVRRDKCGNWVVYLNTGADAVEQRLLAISSDGTVEGAFQSAAFARILDPLFYFPCRNPWNTLFETEQDLLRVSVHVIDPTTGRSGALMMQMASRAVLRRANALYERFDALTRAVRKHVDESLHMTLHFHAKPGAWKDDCTDLFPWYAPLDG